MFLLKKIVKPFFLPPTLVFLVLGAGYIAIFSSRKKAGGKLMLLAGLALYYMFSSSIGANLLLRPLESGYEKVSSNKLDGISTIVLLAGGLRDGALGPAPSRLKQGSLGRLLETARLYHLMESPRIIVAGGSGDPFRPDQAPSKAISEALEWLGIPAERILIDTISRDTYENALQVSKWVGSKPFLLVTSAYHMRRSLAVFRKMGMNPVPAPADFETEEGYSILGYLPSAENLLKSTWALNEYIGMLWYRVRGYI